MTTELGTFVIWYVIISFVLLISLNTYCYFNDIEVTYSINDGSVFDVIILLTMFPLIMLLSFIKCHDYVKGKK